MEETLEGISATRNKKKKRYEICTTGLAFTSYCFYTMDGWMMLFLETLLQWEAKTIHLIISEADQKMCSDPFHAIANNTVLKKEVMGANRNRCGVMRFALSFSLKTETQTDQGERK